MLSEAQKLIIKDVCSIQFESLTDILTTPYLGADSDGDRYEDIMEDMGFGRNEFDHELIKTIHRIKAVGDNPEKVFELDELDMVVLRHILHNNRGNWVYRYPKAMANLWDKLFVHSITHIKQN